MGRRRGLPAPSGPMDHVGGLAVAFTAAETKAARRDLATHRVRREPGASGNVVELAGLVAEPVLVRRRPSRRLRRVSWGACSVPSTVSWVARRSVVICSPPHSGRSRPGVAKMESSVVLAPGRGTLSTGVDDAPRPGVGGAANGRVGRALGGAFVIADRQAHRTPTRLIDNPPRRCGLLVASKDPDGLAHEPSAGLAAWLPNEVPSSPSGLAVV
jgi:hypothetical protein